MPSGVDADALPLGPVEGVISPITIFERPDGRLGADAGSLPVFPSFASKLSVLLEDHIGLTAYYPEIERHYLTVRTGRLVTPLERDAVEGIQRVIRENTPTVFEESVDAVMGEVGKQVPEVRPPRPEDAPTFDPNQPRPPRDPIGEIDPQQSRNWMFASAFNRIWAIILKGKEVHEALEGEAVFSPIQPLAPGVRPDSASAPPPRSHGRDPGP